MIGEKAKIALVVASYFIVSISMVLMNKFLLSKEESIPAPLFVTWYIVIYFGQSIGISVYWQPLSAGFWDFGERIQATVGGEW